MSQSLTGYLNLLKYIFIILTASRTICLPDNLETSLSRLISIHKILFLHILNRGLFVSFLHCFFKCIKDFFFLADKIYFHRIFINFFRMAKEVVLQRLSFDKTQITYPVHFSGYCIFFLRTFHLPAS